MEDAERLHSLKNLATAVYALQAAGFFFGITWIVAIVINYVKKEEVAGDRLGAHFFWQIRTFLFRVLLGVVGCPLLFVILGFPLLFPPAGLVIYRTLKGWLNLNE